MKSEYHVFRLLPGEDIKKGILEYCQENGIKAGAIVTVVGSLQQAFIRMADSVTIEEYHEDTEIVSFTGTISENGGHFHISIADENGKVFGGHVMEGCLVRTTAEIVLADLSKHWKMIREYDENTVYNELVAQHINVL